MSDGAHPSWLRLLDVKKASLVKQGCDESFHISNEEAFRTAFERIPQVRRDNRRPQRCASVLRSNRNIRAFTASLHNAAQPALPGELTTLVWAATLRVVETGCLAKVRLEIILKLLNELNEILPPFTSNLARFHHDEHVQEPLQNLFSTYVDMYLEMMMGFRAGGTGHDFDPIVFRTRIEETAKHFNAIKTAYDEALPVAEQREADALAYRLEQEKAQMGRNFLSNGTEDESSNAYNIRAHCVIEKELGHGAFGVVTQVREITTGEVYARKHIYLRSGSSAGITEKDVQNEVKIMQRLHHDHIATVSFFIKEPHAYSIMMRPVADCNLLSYMELCVDKGYPIAMTKKIYPWFGCILHALAYAHQLDIKHRDVKPGNILIKGSDPYLTDFGAAKDFSLQDMSTSEEYFVKGTPAYRAPEARSEEPSGRKADVFALGCVYSEMLTIIKRKSLKDYQEFRRSKTESASKAYAFRSNLPKVKEWLDKLATASDSLSEILADQVSAMLEEDPVKRPTARTCVRELRTEMALFCEIHQ